MGNGMGIGHGRDGISEWSEGRGAKEGKGRVDIPRVALYWESDVHHSF